MKNIRLFYIFLLLPLFAAFSEAAIVKGIDCSHCHEKANVQHAEVQHDCCALDEGIPVSPGCDVDEPRDKNCPHGGFCQGRDTIPVVVNHVTTSQALGAATTLHPGDCNTAFIITNEQVASSHTPYSAPPLFLSHCSFLI